MTGRYQRKGKIRRLKTGSRLKLEVFLQGFGKIAFQGGFGIERAGRGQDARRKKTNIFFTEGSHVSLSIELFCKKTANK